MMARLEPQNCYVFERCHPDAVVVVPYRCPQLFHIGTRDMNTLHELRVDIGVPKPKCFPFGFLKEAFAEAAVIPWNLGEGFVVTDWRRVDSDGPDHSCRRVKVKSLSYLRVHHGITNTLVQDPLGFCLETWLSQEHSEILAAFPQFEPPYSVVSGALQTDVVEAGTAAYNALTDSSSGQRPHFFKTLSSEDFDGFPKALVPLLKHHASLCKGEVLTATECSQLADTLRTRGGGGRFLHQATLKKFLLSRLPAEVLNVELLGKRGVHGARGAAAQQALAAEPDQTP